MNIIPEICIWTDEDGVGFITPLDILIFHPSIVTDSLWPSLSQWEQDRSLETLFSLRLSRSLSRSLTFSKKKGLPENNFGIPISERARKIHSVHKHKNIKTPSWVSRHYASPCSVDPEHKDKPKGSGHLLFFTLTLSFISFSFNPLISLLLLLVLLHFGPLGSFHAFVELVHFLFNRCIKLDRSLSRSTSISSNIPAFQY